MLREILEGVFDSKKVKDLRVLYTNFNEVESSILNVVNSSINSPAVGGGKGRSGLRDLVHYLKQYLDGNKLAQLNSDRINKINKLAEEILSLSNDIKSDTTEFFEKKYPEEMKKLK